MKLKNVSELPLDEMLLKTVKDKTIDLPITKHLSLRITPHDWASGELSFLESLCVTEAGLSLLQKAVETTFK